MITEARTDAVASESISVVSALTRLLADTYTLYLKTQGYHWNVTGPHFPALHALFEEQYTELAQAVDEIAERIRALGPAAPGSYRQLAAVTRILEDDTVPEALEMVRRLANDHEAVLDSARQLLEAGEAARDAATIDLATRRVAAHEETCWMLRATAA